MDSPVKLEAISHPEERYSASGVPRAEVSILSASLVTAPGTFARYQSARIPRHAFCQVTYRVEPDPDPIRCEFSDINSSPGSCECFSIRRVRGGIDCTAGCIGCGGSAFGGRGISELID
jgi:hypothetical protein